MTKKELGYVEMQWTCPNCGTINPGISRTCQQCGAAQPEDVQFEQAAGAMLRQARASSKRGAHGPAPVRVRL